MQITHDKCGDAPNGDCHDPSYNIGAGAKYLRDRLDNFSGNVLQALGGYNGWCAWNAMIELALLVANRSGLTGRSADMTYSAATAAANSGCCKCQSKSLPRCHLPIF